MSDPWEGIPQELRAAVERVEASISQWGDPAHNIQPALASLRDAIRSLVSRLREAEQQLLWVTTRPAEFWKDGVPLTMETIRFQMAVERSSGETPTP